MARRQRETGFDTLLGVAIRMPPWVFPAVAAFVYLLLRFIVPVVLTNVFKPDDPMAKSFGAVLVPFSVKLAPFATLFVLVIWGFAELKKLMDRRRLDSQTGLEIVGDPPARRTAAVVSKALLVEEGRNVCSSTCWTTALFQF